MAKHSMMPPHAPQNAFKRAPVMGNRGLETRNSKRTSQRKQPLAPVNNIAPIPTSQPIVGALEVQNVKRAINRYGTLPKGARIGAYLESLRQNGESGSPPGNAPVIPSQLAHPNGNAIGLPTTAEVISNHSPRAALKIQPQMIRSNSSGGVTMTNSATASLTKLQRHRTTTDGTMMTTFSSFRSTGSNNSPKRSMQAPSLADLEFPPPPSDLPPPPEEFEESGNLFHHDIPPKHVQINNDVSNTAPSVEEASTRFGVSLRKREPSTDSCSSLGSPANDLTEPSKSPFNDVPKLVDPTLMLMSELAETMLVKPEVRPIKPTTPKPSLPIVAESNGIQFKAQLKKVEPKKVNKEAPKDEITTSIIDFKSRLRKVDDGGDDINKINSKSDNKMISDGKPNNNNTMNGKKTEIKIDIVVDDKKKETETKPGEWITEDDKRKSTGSISSLKKLWEAKELAPAGDQVNQLSPKMGGKKNEHEDNHINNNSTSPSNGHHESGMEPPVAKKPAVPAKPSKFTIYATPIQQSAPKVIENNNHSTLSCAVSSTNSASPASRENILELVQMVECNLKIPVNLITATQWLQLSDKLNVIQSSCVTYADNESMPLHSKFQFRELVTRVENQSNCLRSAGQKNSQDNEKLLVEVGQSLKQLSNALHR